MLSIEAAADAVDAMQMYDQLGFHVMDHPYSEDPTPGAIYLELLP